jgi:hypothetical protein
MVSLNGLEQVFIGGVLLVGGVLLMGVLDRFRGRAWPAAWAKCPCKTLSMLAMSWLTAALLQHPADLPGLLIGAGMFVGSRFGWGEPLGTYYDRRPAMNPANFETWQFGVFTRSALAAIWLRGAIWGVCVLPAAYFDARVLLLALALPLAFVGGAWIGRATHQWDVLEISRGLLLGVMVAAIGLL